MRVVHLFTSRDVFIKVPTSGQNKPPFRYLLNFSHVKIPSPLKLPFPPSCSRVHCSFFHCLFNDCASSQTEQSNPKHERATLTLPKSIFSPSRPLLPSDFPHSEGRVVPRPVAILLGRFLHRSKQTLLHSPRKPEVLLEFIFCTNTDKAPKAK